MSNMTVNGLLCGLYLAPALKQKFNRDGSECAHSLPSGCLRPSFVVGEYPGCPETWMHGSSKSSSYFMSVPAGAGMWLNFNNCERHTHEVAVVVSIQGVNPVTGQKTDVMRLEKYDKKCPIHDVEFKQDRFCEECDFKWPAQNYLATTGTPHSLFWLDGFRRPDGTVRQYIFTEEEIRSVAKAVIGNDRVFAIGIAFYLSKEAKPKPKITRGCSSAGGASGQSVGWAKLSGYTGPTCTTGSVGQTVKGALYSQNGVYNYSDAVSDFSPDYHFCPSDSAPTGMYAQDMTCADISMEHEEKTGGGSIIPKKIEVGAGAMIAQEIYPDPKDISFWEEEPVGMVYVNYCDNTTAARILEAGKRKEKSEGFMDGVKVGN